MHDFFTEIMEFKETNVTQFTNLTKHEIINELNKLAEEAEEFDKRMIEQEKEGNLAICVIWVGHSLNSSVKVHRKIL